MYYTLMLTPQNPRRSPLRTEIAYVSFEDLVNKMQVEKDSLRILSPATVRTILVAAVFTRSLFQRDERGDVDPFLQMLVLQVNWLAEKAMTDEGFNTEDLRLPAFHDVNDYVIEIENGARAKLAHPTIGSEPTNLEVN